MKIDAILWDYDGTIVNSAPKNMEITKEILGKMVPRLSGKSLPAWLKTEKNYHFANHASENWQDLYVNFYGLTEKEMLNAGKLWTEYQLKNTTPVKIFPGIYETVKQIKFPQGICSQNSALNIQQVLKENHLLDKFRAIVGYDDIPSDAQKPNPLSGIICLKQLLNETAGKTIFYIGDHEGDIAFARNIEKELVHQTKVIAILAKYSGANSEKWKYKPDFEIEDPSALLNLINGKFLKINYLNKHSS